MNRLASAWTTSLFTAGNVIYVYPRSQHPRSRSLPVLNHKQVCLQHWTHRLKSGPRVSCYPLSWGGIEREPMGVMQWEGMLRGGAGGRCSGRVQWGQQVGRWGGASILTNGGCRCTIRHGHKSGCKTLAFKKETNKTADLWATSVTICTDEEKWINQPNIQRKEEHHPGIKMRIENKMRRKWTLSLLSHDTMSASERINHHYTLAWERKTTNPLHNNGTTFTLLSSPSKKKLTTISHFCLLSAKCCHKKSKCTNISQNCWVEYKGRKKTEEAARTWEREQEMTLWGQHQQDLWPKNHILQIIFGFLFREVFLAPMGGYSVVERGLKIGKIKCHFDRFVHCYSQLASKKGYIALQKTRNEKHHFLKPLRDRKSSFECFCEINLN